MKKIIYATLLTIASLALCGAPITRKARIEGENAELKNTGANSAFATMEFSLEGIKNVKLASIGCVGSTGKDGALYPSLTLKHGGKAVSAYTSLKGGNNAGLRFYVTKEISNALAAGKKNIKFTLSQDGLENAQSSFSLKHADMTIIDADTDIFDLEQCLRPVFNSGTMKWESVFPLGAEDGSAAKAKLFFSAKRVIEAFTFDDANNVVQLKEGVDFKVVADNFEVLPNSKIRTIKYSDFYKPKTSGSKPPHGYFNFAVKNCYAFFREGNWFHKHHVYISYEHDASIQNPSGKPDLENLPRTLSKLKNGKPVKIVLFGDSISHGANASANSITYPYMPSWGDLTAMALTRYYKNPNISYLNRALGGTNSKWGDAHVDSLVAVEKPDLVILAFGMNDRLDAEKRTALSKSMMDKIRARNPDVEFIIVEAMSANPLWQKFEMHNDYKKADDTLKAHGVSIADVRSAHKTLMTKKRFVDMTGNNVNHPNDFLIRVYAQTVLRCLVPMR